MFENSLVPRRRPIRRARAIGISFALHAGVAVTAIGAAAWTVDAVADPKTHDVFLEVRLPPPAEPSGDRDRPTGPTKPEIDSARPEVEQPREPEDELVTEPEAESASTEVLLADSDLEIDGGGNGGDGVPGGVDSDGDGESGNGPGVLASAPLPDDDSPVRLSGAMTPPRLRPESRVEPRYTEAARRVHLSGTVILEAVIDERGEVRKVQVIKGLPLGLDQAAIDAVRHWRFEPARLGDRPVAVYFTLTVRFVLR